VKQIRIHRQNPLLPKTFTLVDDEDYDWLKKFTWYYYKYSRTAYAKTFIDGVCIGMHTLILEPPSKDITVDHKDSNGLNNQRVNLRFANLQQQRQNKSKHLNSTSQYKGVSYVESRDKWTAQICIDGKQKCLGRFNDELTAAKVYNIAARKQFGEFAKLNVFFSKSAIN
jgi:hypothetical protein